MDINDQAVSSQVKNEIKDLKNEKKKISKVIVYLVCAFACIVAGLLLRESKFQFLRTYRNITISILFATASSFGILVLSRLLQSIMAHRIKGKALLYNLVKILRLSTFLVIVFIFISFLNENWYTAAVSLGLISLLLGFALQTPIASLIGWFYIVMRMPFRVGDRIQVGSFTGDVVEINFLDTTLWEFAGNYITNDLPSGRLIRFPNSLIFQNQIYNYSWQKFPYIWNEVSFNITYASDLGWVERTIRDVALNELDPATKEHVKSLRAVIAATPVEEIDIQDYPFVTFRINPNNWVEAVLVYIVNPKQSSELRSRIVKQVIKTLNREPSRVSFVPEGG